MLIRISELAARQSLQIACCFMRFQMIGLHIMIRKAMEKDWDEIAHLLKDMHLAHGSISIQNFWVTLEDDQVIAMAQLEPIDLRDPSTSPSTQQVECSASLRMRGRKTSTPHIFLSSVGVRNDYRGRGIAKALINKMLLHVDQEVYLYTIIPEYFGKLGFVRTTPPDEDDYRKHFDCKSCTADKCICMKKPVTLFQPHQQTSHT